MTDTAKAEQENKALKESISKYKEELKELILYRGEDFSKLVCEGVLADPGAQIPFALSILPDSDSGHKINIRARERYRYLASLALKQSTVDRQVTESEYVSMSVWVENRERLERKFHRLDDYPFLFNGTFHGIEDIWYPFFSNLAEAIGLSITQIASMIYEGVPLYQKSSDGSFGLVPYDDEDYVYLRQRGKHYESFPAYEMPDYVSRFYIKPAHEKWHDIIFTFDGLLSDDEFQERKSLLTKQIGSDHLNAPTKKENEIQSETYKKLHEALIHFPISYPRYKTKKPKLDIDIRPWLKSVYGLTDRESHVFGSIIAEHFEI